jgi:hypothetical protein
MGELFVRVLDWIEEQPDWARPILYGAVAVPAFAVLRGAIVLVPLVAVVMLVRGEPVARELALLAAAFALAVAGGALSGAAYSLLGRHTRRIAIVGPYLAGWLSCWPYVLALMAILWLHDEIEETARLGHMAMLLGTMTFWVGLLVGHFFLRED